MQVSRAVSSSIELISGNKSLIGAVTAALLMCPASYAASFGHSRIVSALGQPLHINVQVSQLSADDVRSFSAVPAPASAWTQAGLIPPVDPASMHLELVDGYAPGSKLIEIRSTETFNKPVADLLLDIRTASGQQRYQVSLLTHARPEDVMAPRAGAASASASAAPSGLVPMTIHVKRGDTMFSIARRHAVPGVTVYQMMIALQRANPQAFIHDNLNLVKAGATLTMPNKAALTAVSDREARRLFQQQTQAFAQYRQRAAAGVGTVVGEGAASGQVTSAAPVPASEVPGAPQDQLRLSGAQTTSGGNQAGAVDAADSARADDAEATRKGIADSQQRVSQLEENVKTLNQALHSQGAAASDLVLDSAKGLTQSLAEVADAVAAGNDDDTDSAAAQAGRGSKGAGSGQAAGNDQAAGNGASAVRGASGGNAAANSGIASNGAGQGAGTGSDPAGNQSGVSGASHTGAQGGAGGPAANPSGTAALPGTGATQGSGPAQDGSASGNHEAGINVPAGNSGQADGRSANNASSAADQTAGATESNSTKAEESVSWFQEHMLGVITGALAFIVLIIAWLLRRANTARDEGREGNTGPITEAMVKEKLEQINLELEEQQPARPRRDTH